MLTAGACAACGDDASTSRALVVGGVAVDAELCEACDRRSPHLVRSLVEDGLADGRVTVEDPVYGAEWRGPQ